MPVWCRGVPWTAPAGRQAQGHTVRQGWEGAACPVGTPRPAREGVVLTVKGVGPAVKGVGPTVKGVGTTPEWGMYVRTINHSNIKNQ